MRHSRKVVMRELFEILVVRKGAHGERLCEHIAFVPSLVNLHIFSSSLSAGDHYVTKKVLIAFELVRKEKLKLKKSGSKY